MNDDPDPAPAPPLPDIGAAWFVIPMSVVAAVLIALGAHPEPAAPSPPPAQPSQDAVAAEIPEL